MAASGATVAIDGAGVVGGRLARQLVSTEADPGVEIRARSADRRAELVEAFPSEAVVRDCTEPVGESVGLVVLSGSQDTQVRAAEAHLAARRHVVTITDRPEVVRSLLGLDALARGADRCLVIGAGFSPGLSGLMASRSAMDLDSTDEIHYARHGAGGRLCAAERHRALRHEVPVWHDGEWVGHRPGTGRELCWFPDPIGGADAYRAATAEPLLAVAAVDSLRRCSARLVLSRWDRLAQYLPVLVPAPVEGGVGALRVEVRGQRDGRRCTRVLGCLDRPAVAAAAVAAEVVRSVLAGEIGSGASGLEQWPDPGEMLSRLHRRGVRIAELD